MSLTSWPDKKDKTEKKILQENTRVKGSIVKKLTKHSYRCILNGLKHAKKLTIFYISMKISL